MREICDHTLKKDFMTIVNIYTNVGPAKALGFFGRLMHKELGSGISDNPLYPYRSRKFTSS